MKNSLLAFAAILFSCGLFAQEFPYTLNVTQEEYVPLEGSISLNEGEVWDDPEYVIPFGFDFAIGSDVVNQGFTAATGSAIVFSSDFTLAQFIFAYLPDIIDAGYAQDSSLSNISYLVEGNVGNRICKIEWDDCGFYNEYADLGTSANRVSFQLWLYETTNSFKIHFGPNSIKDPSNLFDNFLSFGVIEDYDVDNDIYGNVWLVSDDPLAPTVELFDVETYDYENLPNLTYQPNNGTCYFFDTGIVDIEENESFDFSVYPSVTEGLINIKRNGTNQEINLDILNISGALVHSAQIRTPQETLDLSSLSSGIYMMRFSDGLNAKTYKIVKR